MTFRMTRRRLKVAAIRLYCFGFLPAAAVAWIFARFELRRL